MARFRRATLRVVVLQCALMTNVCFAQIQNDVAPPAPRPDVIFVPTPAQVVDLMLHLAAVKKDDVVYDLGCGDGRLVIVAAKKFGAHGVGIDIEPKLIAHASSYATAAKVTDKVQFRAGDLFTSDFHDATVLTLYLQDHLNVRLRPLIFAQVKPGTRIVSHMFRMGDWPPVAAKSITLEGINYEVFLWVVPANISGRWKVTAPRNRSGLPPTFVVEQRFQQFTIRGADGNESIGAGSVTGSNFSVTTNVGENRNPGTFTGRFEGNRVIVAAAGKTQGWKAEREPGTEKPLDEAVQR